MIYNIYERYSVKFYKDSRTGKSKVREMMDSLEPKIKEKSWKYMDFLAANEAYLEEPYSRHVKGKIRELRVDFAHNFFRIFYFCLIGKKIVILHAYFKKSNKAPKKEINRAIVNYYDAINNVEIYED